jgi:hypothetical protein
LENFVVLFTNHVEGKGRVTTPISPKWVEAIIQHSNDPSNHVEWTLFDIESQYLCSK